MGSDAVTSISTWSHLGHSDSRCSKPIGPNVMRSCIIRVWQREQRARPIPVKSCWVEDMVLPCIGRERYRTLSHRWLPTAGGDAASLPQRKPETVINIAQSRRFHKLNQPPTTGIPAGRGHRAATVQFAIEQPCPFRSAAFADRRSRTEPAPHERPAPAIDRTPRTSAPRQRRRDRDHRRAIVAQIWVMRLSSSCAASLVASLVIFAHSVPSGDRATGCKT
jgi:hypothetical protein